MLSYDDLVIDRSGRVDMFRIGFHCGYYVPLENYDGPRHINDSDDLKQLFDAIKHMDHYELLSVSSHQHFLLRAPGERMRYLANLEFTNSLDTKELKMFFATMNTKFFGPLHLDLRGEEKQLEDKKYKKRIDDSPIFLSPLDSVLLMQLVVPGAYSSYNMGGNNTMMEFYTNRYKKRVKDLCGIIANIDDLKNVVICAPGDGFGSAFTACKCLGVPCVSGDSYDGCVDWAKQLGNDVHKEDYMETIDRCIMHYSGKKRIVVLISHLLEFAPRLARYKGEKIIFERDTLYESDHTMIYPIYDNRYVQISETLKWKGIPFVMTTDSRIHDTLPAWTDVVKQDIVYAFKSEQCLKWFKYLFNIGTRVKYFYQEANEVEVESAMARYDMIKILKPQSVLFISWEGFVTGKWHGIPIDDCFNLKFGKRSSQMVVDTRFPVKSVLDNPMLVVLSNHKINVPPILWWENGKVHRCCGIFSRMRVTVDVGNSIDQRYFYVQETPPAERPRAKSMGYKKIDFEEVEMVDYYHKDLTKFGRAPRGAFPTMYLKSCHLLVVQDKNVRLSVRSEKKKLPGFLDFTAGGVVQSGETVREALFRESYEELNCLLDKSKIGKRYDCFPADGYNAINSIFIYNCDIKTKNIDEFSSTFLVPISDLPQLIKQYQGKIKHDLEVFLREWVKNHD